MIPPFALFDPITQESIQMIVKDILGKNLKCSSESIRFLTDICTEFVRLLSSESNSICEKMNKKLISSDHVLQALKELDFENYIEETKKAHEQHVDQIAPKKKKKKLTDSGLTLEELERDQKKLFEEARNNLNLLNGASKS